MQYTYLDVWAEVGNSLVDASISQVVVHPSDEDLLGGQLQQVFYALPFFQQEYQTRVRCQVDLTQ